MKKLAIFFLSVLLLVPTGARACWDDDWDDWEDTGSWDDDDWYDDSWYDDDWYDDGDDIAWDETLDGVDIYPDEDYDWGLDDDWWRTDYSDDDDFSDDDDDSGDYNTGKRSDNSTTIGTVGKEFKDYKIQKGDKIIIKDFSCSVKAGQKIAIVGPTGAGKTTVVKLLMRYYDLSSGKILLDGRDIADYKRSALREEFGMVLQDTWLYSGTVMDNIRYGRLDAKRGFKQSGAGKKTSPGMPDGVSG